MFYVYKITNLVNGKVYIGKSINALERWTEHRRIARHPGSENYYLFHKAINKYGSNNFKFEIIDTFNTEEDSLRGETQWISFYQTNITEYGSKYGYNLTAGGEGISGFKFSEEQRKRMSEARLGELNSFYGKTHTDEARQKISEHHKEFYATNPSAWLGKTHTEETKKLMSEIKIGTQVGENNPMFGKTRTLEEKAKIRKTRKERESTYNYPKGSDKIESKLDEDKVSQIYLMIMDGITDKEIAIYFNITRKLITDIRLGQIWKHVPRPKELSDGRKKLTKELVIQILRLIRSNVDDFTIAQQYNIKPRTVQRIRTGKIWKSVPR